MIASQSDYCRDRREFVEAFMRAVRELGRLHAARLKATADGQIPPTDAELDLARERKETAKAALTAHILVHRCTPSG